MTDLLTGDPILPQNTSVGSLGKLDSAGNLYIAVPSGTMGLHATPSTPGRQWYAFGPGMTPIPVTLTANGNDLSQTTPTFCVGQQITFNLNVAATNALCNWTPSGKFVNAASTNAGGCITYTNNTSLLNSLGTACQCWYYNGPSGAVSVGANIILGGKSLSTALAGQFNIYRPSVSMNQILEPREFTITPGTLGGATVKLGTPGQNAFGEMAYVVEYDTTKKGQGEITQTCQLSYNPDPGGYNFTDWRCDGSTNYVGLETIYPYGQGRIDISLDDGPQNGTTVSTAPIEVKGQFMDYIMFQPDYANSIFVTLGIVTWNLDGKIAYQGNPASWQFVITNSPDPVGPDNSDTFPQFTQFR